MRRRTRKNIKQLQKLLEVNRIRLLRILIEKDTCVCQMVKKTKIKHNLISHHLKTLMDMGYLKNQKNGLHSIYSLKPSKQKYVKKVLDLVTQ